MSAPEPTGKDFRQLNRSLAKLSRKRKLALCRHVLGPGRRLRVIRDFVLMDSENLGNLKSRVTVLHLPTLRWHGFDCSFENARHLLNDPAKDKELLTLIMAPTGQPSGD
jgi:hypothetical protein